MNEPPSPSGPQLSRRERKKRQTRKRILDSALTLMAERGYDTVKVDEIAKTADVANATFFLHFPTKASLIVAFNEQVTDKVAARLDEFHMGAVEKLELLRAIMLDEWAQQREMLRPLVIDAARQDGGAFTGAGDSLVTLLEDIIRGGQESGEINREFDATVVAQCLAASWRAGAIRWAQDGDADAARLANRQSLDLILYGATPRV